MTYVASLLPPETRIDRHHDAFGAGLEWFTVYAPGFVIEGEVGQPEDDLRSFVDDHADPEDVAQLMIVLREWGLTT